MPAAQDAGIGLLPWSPLGGGWLTGKYRRDEAPTGATRLGENPERGMESWSKRNSDERTWQVLDAVGEIAAAHGASPSQIALAWLDTRPAMTSTILGVRTPEQLADNLGALEVELTDAEIARLTEVSASRVEDYPYGAPAVEQRHRRIEGGR